MKNFALIAGIGILNLALANAQETPRFNFDVGAGFTQAVGSTARDLNTGWNIGGGAGVNLSRSLGIKLDASWNGMYINGPTLFNLGVAAGDVHIFSATLDPVVRLAPFHHVDFYLTGGGGWFRASEQFRSPFATAESPFFGNNPGPFGAFSNYSVNKPGFDVGAGFEFGGFPHGKFFAEAKWDHMFLAGSRLDYVPVTFGFRW